jgi:hypothetical protein
MAVTYFTGRYTLFSGPANAGVKGPWADLRNAKQLRIWAKASSPTTVVFRYTIFGEDRRNTDYIDTTPYSVGTNWTEIMTTELDGPLTYLAVIPQDTIANLEIVAAGSAI